MTRICFVFALILAMLLPLSTMAAQVPRVESLVERSDELLQFKQYVKENQESGFFESLHFYILNGHDTTLSGNREGRLVLTSPRFDNPVELRNMPNRSIIVDEQGLIVAFVSDWHLPIDYFSQFQHMLGLRILDCDYYYILGGNPTLTLTGLPKLQELILNYCNIGNLDLQISSTDLRCLDLRINPLLKIVGLENYPSLWALDVSDTGIQEKIDGLESLAHLRELDISSAKYLTKPLNLKYHRELERLDALNCSVCEVRNIHLATSLKSLKTRAPVADPLPVRLEELCVYNEKMAEIPHSVSKMKNLQILAIRGNIKQITHLTNLPKLTRIDLRGNKIEKIENLGQLPALEKLFLSSNPISKMEGLDGAPNIKELYLRETNISKIEGLRHMNKIEYLDLKDSKVNALIYSPDFDPIEFIALDNNPISQYEYEKFYDKKIGFSLWNTPFYNRLKDGNEEQAELRRKLAVKFKI